MDSNKIIDLLGGTQAVSAMCFVSKGAVSQWRKNGIPESRLMFLRLARPDVFGDVQDRRIPKVTQLADMKIVATRNKPRGAGKKGE